MVHPVVGQVARAALPMSRDPDDEYFDLVVLGTAVTPGKAVEDLHVAFIAMKVAHHLPEDNDRCEYDPAIERKIIHRPPSQVMKSLRPVIYGV
jgi:hypothetical protein